MIVDCEAGKIDLVITKSISRFARNTQDCLTYSRKLKELRIPIIFEKENINTMDATGELLFTILSSLAQEESRNISENCKWAIRHNFQSGKPSINTTHFMGYDKDENGKLIINKEQAKVIERIFHMFEDGMTPPQISRALRADKVKGTKSNTWPSHAIIGILQNEKYAGDILMQKTYTEDFLTKKKVKNKGEVDQYFMENCHEAIIPKDEWKAVQLELKRRETYKQEVGIFTYGNDSSPFATRIVCGRCGKSMKRCSCSRNGTHFWMCDAKKRNGSDACSAENVLEKSLYRAFRIALNDILSHPDDYTGIWDKQIAEGNPLERLRAKQMKLLAEDGVVDCDVPELIVLVLERIVVYDKTKFEVRFLDGNKKVICLPEE